MSATTLHCTILGTIAAFWIKLLASPSPPHLISTTHTHPYSLISSHPLSSYNPLVKPFLSMQTPQPEGPCQGKSGRGGGFCFVAHFEEEKKNPNYFLSWCNLTCCDNCSVRNFFDISEREDFLHSNQASRLKIVASVTKRECWTH